MAFRRKLHKISKKKRNMHSMDSLRSYVGKRVFSKSGERLGRVHDVMIEKDSFTGIVVMKNNLSKIFIGKGYIQSVSKDAVMISMNPVILMMGKAVFDADGNRLGKVSGISRKTDSNDFTHILVKRRFYSKPLRIPKGDVAVAKKNIILKKAYH